MVVILPIPAFVALRRATYRVGRKVHARNWSKQRSFSSFVSDVLTGNRVVKAFAHEDIEQKKFDKRIFKKAGDELQAYLAFKRRGSATKSKKGKGSYDRKKFKRGED